MRRSLTVALVALAIGLYVFPLTCRFALLDPDEGLHAAISQEMLERGDLVVPRFLGEPFPDKPILFFWAQVLSFAAFGENEPAARLPGLVFGALGAWTTGLLAGVVFGSGYRRERWLATAFYATLILPMALTQVPVHDVALVPWTNLALLAFWRAAHAPSPRLTMTQSLFAGVWLGLAMLTKGLTGVALVGIAHLTLLLLERRLSIAVVGGGIIALAAGVAISSPWYLAMEQAQPGYLRYYFLERHLGGFATETQRHANRPWFYYLGVLAGGGLPWVLYVPFARLRGSKRKLEPSTPVPNDSTGPDAAARLGWCWLLTGLLFLSVAGSKLFTYALPLFPAVAILATVAWTRWLDSPPFRAGLKPGPSDRQSPDSSRMERPAFSPAGDPHSSSPERPGFSPAGVLMPRAARWTLALQGIVAAALVPSALLAAQQASPWRAPWWLWLTCVPVACAFLYATFRARAGAPSSAAACAAWTLTASVVLVLTTVLPPVAEWYSARDLARTLNARGAFPPELWMLKERPGSVVFYLTSELRRGLTPDRIRIVTPYDLLRWNIVPGTLVAIEEDDLSRVRSFTPLAQLPYERAGHFRLYDPRLFRR